MRSTSWDRPVVIDSPLITAVQARDTERALACVARTRPEDLDVGARVASYTPLHGAAVCGIVDVVAALLA
jgi:hypothetical protein